MSNIKHLLVELHQRPIAYYPVYRKITGSTTAGILLSQLMFWWSKVDGKKFYKTDAEIMEETCLTDNELRGAKAALKKLSFIKITREGIPAKTFYEINPTNLFREINETCDVESTKQEELNQRDSILQENTQENTTLEKKAPKGAPPKKQPKISNENGLIKKMACDFDVAYSHLSNPKSNSLNWGAAAAEKIRWTGKEIGNISHIRDALQKRMMDRGAEVTDENTLKNWRMFLEMAIGLKDDFLNRNFTPSILYSQFNSIVLKLNQNRNGAKFNKPITIISDETKRAAFQELIDEGYFDNQRTY